MSFDFRHSSFGFRHWNGESRLKQDAPRHMKQNHVPSFLVLRRFELGEFFLRTVHIVLACDSQFKKLLLTP
jgi:hypothetical protein